jgi:hypothetical protein
VVGERDHEVARFPTLWSFRGRPYEERQRFAKALLKVKPEKRKRPRINMMSGKNDVANRGVLSLIYILLR